MEVRRRRLGVRFRRQVPIGPYVADFACLEERLVVEIDGSVHDHKDESARTAYLQKQGFRVVRIDNDQVEDVGVRASLLRWLTEHGISGNALPPNS
jgi:very-short-patch-repair endonuclease